jgi:predicted AAA+ superfamily ATPase
MESEKIKQLLLEQSQIMLSSDMVARDLKTHINRFKDEPVIVIISGIRRSGKSALMHQIRSEYQKDSYYVN